MAKKVKDVRVVASMGETLPRIVKSKHVSPDGSSWHFVKHATHHVTVAQFKNDIWNMMDGKAASPAKLYADGFSWWKQIKLPKEIRQKN